MDRRFFFFYWRFIVTIWKTFGAGRAIVQCLGLTIVALDHFLMFLDRIFFPRYRRTPIVRPVFIIGHPRSGTTFLHRLVTQTGDFSCFKTWELTMPSLTGRVLVRPFLRFFARMLSRYLAKGGEIYPDGSHRVAHDSIEEEELLFLHWADTFFVNKTPLAFDDRDNQELCRYDEQPAAYRRRSVRRFRECLQRQVYWTGRTQVVAKMPYSTMRIKTLMEEFPDARFIYMVRSPFETIVSHLSQHRAYFETRWGLKNIPADKLQRYFERRYRANVDLYRYFHDLRTRGEVPRDRVWELPYDRLLTDLNGVFEEFQAFTGIRANEALALKVREQASRQKDYRAGHSKLDLESFGLTRERILQDLGFVFDDYGFRR